ncbi:Hydrogenase-3 component E [Raoultella terrigena]|uniref:Hydrogenase-3 component E n=1 Tax=Raoultella terrigena TaxID=577 RepID=A0A4U9D617_RAOTE|nr:Hydrogenase-3 component E [Raoultella terrigena]
MGIVVPERAQMIRAILLEVERLHSHLLNLGLACHFTGFDSGFMQFFRVRETSMKMAEILTGARKTYGLNLIGGIRRDLLKEDMIQTASWRSRCARDVQELVEMLLSTPNMAQRTVGHRPPRPANRPRLQQRWPDGARQRPRARYPRRPSVRRATACCRWKCTASRAAT